MRLTALHLQNVKRHVDLTVDLKPGLNVIHGPNEAGKSTIQRAIEVGLFKRATSSSDDLDGLRRWGTKDAPPTVTVSFEDEGVPGKITKVFAGSKGTVELRTGKDVMTDATQVEHVIASLTGLPTEKFFRATASVHHQELIGLKQDEATLRDRLQQSMSGADRGTYAAKKKLEEAIRKYRTEGAKNPGYLKATRTEVARLEAAVASGEAALKQLELDRKALAEARDARRVVDEELAKLRANLATSERSVALLQKQSDAEERYVQYKRAAELNAEIAQLEATHPSTLPLATLKAAVERLRTLEYRLSEMRAELASEPDVSNFDLTLPNLNPRRWNLIGVALLVAAVLLGAGAVALGQTIVGVILAVLLAVAGVGAFVAAARMRGAQRRRAAAYQLREAEVARRLRGGWERVDELREAEREREAVLATTGVTDMTAAETLLNDEQEHVGKIETAKAEYRGLFSDKPPKGDVEAIRDASAAEAEEWRHALSGMGEIGADPQKSQAQYRAGADRVSGEREKALTNEAGAEAKLAANGTDAEQVAADSEALEDAREQLGQAERRLRIWEETLAALNEAERATMKKAARFLEQSMSKDVAKITGGRYRRLQVDEANLAFKVFSPEFGDWVSV